MYSQHVYILCRQHVFILYNFVSRWGTGGWQVEGLFENPTISPHRYDDAKEDQKIDLFTSSHTNEKAVCACAGGTRRSAATSTMLSAQGSDRAEARLQQSTVGTYC